MSKLTTYASKVNTRASFTKRTQSLTKINNLGFGVIYYWHWGWSFSPYEVYDPQEEDKLKQAAKDGSIPYSKNPKAQKSGRFMYLGLAVQLPTMVRIKAHLEQANSANPNNTKALALAQGIKTDLTTAKSQDAIISDPQKIPNIIHICSLFDLAPLESYYIESKYNLNQSGKGRSFLDIINNGKVSHSEGGVPTLGVNTEAEGSEAAGQGSPIKQGDVRGTPEWIMAAYWFLSETDSTVLAARNQKPYGFNAIYDKAVKEKSLNKSVEKVFELFAEHPQVSQIVANKFRSITPEQIATILKIMGVSDTIKLDGLKENDYINKEDILERNFAVDKFFTENGIGAKLEALISFDLASNKKQMSKSQKLILTKDKVSTELRTMLVDYLLGINQADFGLKSADSIISNLSISLEKGLTLLQMQVVDLLNKANQIAKQTTQVGNKLTREAIKLKSKSDSLPSLIEKKMNELIKITREVLEPIAYEHGLRGLENALNEVPVDKKKTKAIVGMKMAAAKKETKKSFNEAVSEGVSVLYSVYSAFQKLQSALNETNAGLMEQALKEIKAQ